MSTDVPSAFAFLHSRTVAAFGTTSRIWWPTARKGTTYTTEIEAVAGPVGAKAAALIGALVIPADALILHATASDFPDGFEPRPEDCFFWGVTVATGKKYKIITATRMDTNHSHWRITAERN